MTFFCEHRARTGELDILVVGHWIGVLQYTGCWILDILEYSRTFEIGYSRSWIGVLQYIGGKQGRRSVKLDQTQRNGAKNQLLGKIKK